MILSFPNNYAYYTGLTGCKDIKTCLWDVAGLYYYLFSSNLILQKDLKK